MTGEGREEADPGTLQSRPQSAFYCEKAIFYKKYRRYTFFVDGGQEIDGTSDRF